MYSIDLQPWEFRQGSSCHVRPDRVPQAWQCAAKRLMGSRAAAPAVVRELWHARGELYSDDLEGLVSVLALGGSAVLHAVGTEVHFPRATTVTFASHVPTAGELAATVVKWRGHVETRVRTLLVITLGERRKWGDAAEYANVPVPAEGDSMDECMLAHDHTHCGPYGPPPPIARGCLRPAPPPPPSFWLLHSPGPPCAPFSIVTFPRVLPYVPPLHHAFLSSLSATPP